MPKSIARLNIQHYRKLLAEETEATKRETIKRLLAEEEAKLKSLEANPREQKFR